MNTFKLADRVQEDQGEDGENNTYEDAASLNDLYPVDGDDGDDDDDKSKYKKLFFFRTLVSSSGRGLSSKIKMTVRSRLARGHEERQGIF